MPQYHGYCPRCKNAGPVFLETLVNRPPVYCNSCRGLMEVSSQPLATIQNTPQATVTQVGPHADDVNVNGSLVWLSQGRRDFFIRLMQRAFTDERGLAGYPEV